MKSLQEIAKKHNVTDRIFLKCIAVNGLLSALKGKFAIDIIKTDKNLSNVDSEYNSEECTYKGKSSSMNEYITAKWGENYTKFIEELL